MAKRLFRSVVIAAALTFAAGRPGAAQSIAPDAVSAQRNSGIPATSPTMPADLSAVESTSKPKPVCKPCLFYSGDLDPSNPDSNAIVNVISKVVLAQIYSAFTVPAGKPWHVKGVFINTLSSTGVLDPSVTQWSIWKGVGASVPGQLLFSGAGKATIVPSGRTFFSLTEYTVSVKLKPSVVLQPGTYWLNVTPQCSNPGNSACSPPVPYYLSDVEDASPANHVGPANVLDNSFIDSSFFAFAFTPLWGPTGACGGGCDAFSFGLIGN